MVNILSFLSLVIGGILIYFEQFLNIWNEKSRTYFFIYVSCFLGLPTICSLVFNFFESSQNLWVGGIFQILAYSILAGFFIYNDLYWYLRDRTAGLRPTVIIGIAFIFLSAALTN